MNFSQRIKYTLDIWRALGQKTQAVSNPVDWQQALAGSNVYKIPDMGRQDAQLSLYEKLSWLQIAVSTVAQFAAASALEVHQVSGEKETDIDNHPFEKLLRQPNPLQSRFEFLESTFSFYKLLGNAFWWLNKSTEKAEPAEIWTIPANRMRPVPDRQLYLKGYIYTDDWGVEWPLELWEVVHFKRFNPRDPFNGLSCIQALAIDAHADLKASEWNAKLWGQNNGRLPGILAFQDNYTDEQWSRIIDMTREGSAKRNLMMLRNVKQGGIQLIQNTLSQKDIEFLNSRNFTKEEIFAMVSPGLSSILAINATEANSKTGKATIAEFAIYPMHCAVAEKITNDVLPVYGESLRAEFDDVRMTDRSLELQETSEYGKYHTVDEVRDKFYNDQPLMDNPAGKLLPAQIGQQTGAPAPTLGTTPQDQGAQPVGTSPAAQAVVPSDELLPVKEEKARWLRKALRAFKAGKPAAVLFESEVIPSLEAGRISVALADCKTVEAIKAVFDGPEPVDSILVLAHAIENATKMLETAES